MSDQTLPTVRITSPAQLVAGISALLGFHPTESLVAVLLEGRRGLLHDACTRRRETACHGRLAPCANPQASMNVLKALRRTADSERLGPAGQSTGPPGRNVDARSGPVCGCLAAFGWACQSS